MAQLKKIAPERSHIMLRSQVKPARQAEPVASSEAAVSPNGENSNSVASFGFAKNSYNIFINRLQSGYYKAHPIRILYGTHLTAYRLTVLSESAYR